MAKRGERGGGSVYREASRGWRGEIQKNGVRKIVRGATEAECRRRLAQACSDLEAGRKTVRITTVGDVLEHYERTMLDAGRTSSNSHSAGQTISQHRWAVSRWRDAVGGRLVRSFTTRDVDDALAGFVRRDGKPLSIRSAKQLLTSLRLCFEESVRAGLVESNPAVRARLPKGLTEPRERNVLRSDEIRLAAEAALVDPSDARIAFCLLLGLRPGEAAGLCWDAVDLRTKSLAVCRTRRDEKPEVLVDKTKTQRSRRRLDLPVALAEYLHTRRVDLMAAGHPPQGRDLIFTRNGGICTRSSDRDAIKRLTAAVGLPRITMHDCRRSYATAQAEAGVNPYHLAAALGDSVETVFRVYVNRDVREGIRPLLDLTSGDQSREPSREITFTYNG